MNELMAKVAKLEAENVRLKVELDVAKRTLDMLHESTEEAAIATAAATMRVASQEAARAILDDVKGIV